MLKKWRNNLLAYTTGADVLRPRRIIRQSSKIVEFLWTLNIEMDSINEHIKYWAPVWYCHLCVSLYFVLTCPLPDCPPAGSCFPVTYTYVQAKHK